MHAVYRSGFQHDKNRIQIFMLLHTLGIQMMKVEKKKYKNYKNYKEIPGSRSLPTLEDKYRRMAEQFRNDGCDGYAVEKLIRQEMERDEYQ